MNNFGDYLMSKFKAFDADYISRFNANNLVAKTACESEVDLSIKLGGNAEACSELSSLIIQKGEPLVIRVTNMTVDLRAEELEMRLIDTDDNVWSSLRNLLMAVVRVYPFIGSDLEQLDESGVCTL